MSFEILNAEEVAGRQIKSYLGTLSRYRNTSMVLHGRCVESTYLLAAELLLQVTTIAAEHEGSPLVSRWVAKFNDYVNQYDLVTLPSKGKINGKASEDGDAILPNVGQNRPNLKT